MKLGRGGTFFPFVRVDLPGNSLEGAELAQKKKMKRRKGDRRERERRDFRTPAVSPYVNLPQS